MKTKKKRMKNLVNPIVKRLIKFTPIQKAFNLTSLQQAHINFSRRNENFPIISISPSLTQDVIQNSK